MQLNDNVNFVRFPEVCTPEALADVLEQIDDWKRNKRREDRFLFHDALREVQRRRKIRLVAQYLAGMSNEDIAAAIDLKSSGSVW